MTSARLTPPLSHVLFLLGCFAIPFYNDTPLFMYISDIFRSPSNFIFLLSLVLFGIEQLSSSKYRIKVRFSDLCFIVGLVIFIIFSLFVNIDFSGNIQGVGITGIEKMLLTSANMIILLIFLLFYTHILSVIELEKLLKYIRLGFLVTLLYVLLEIVNYVIPITLSGGGSANSYIMDLVDSFIHERDRAPGMPRARGLAFEPSYLVAVLFFLLPFLIADKNQYRTFIIVGWLICVLATDSPTGIVALLVFLIFYRFSIYLSIVICFVAAFFLFIFVVFYVDIPMDKMESTATRVWSWISSITLLKDHFLFGVGPGMQGYWVIHNYPDFFWSIRQTEVWINLGLNSFAAPTFGTLLTIVLSIGLLPIAYVIIYMTFTGRINEIVSSPLARASLASMFVVSFGLNGYVFLGYWIFLAMTLSGKWGELEKIKRYGCKVKILSGDSHIWSITK